MVAGNLYLIEARSQHLLASTFLRFQEYYESPKFRGEIFSLEEFMDWYAKECGNFTYYEDWVGFNIPSWIFTNFREGKFDPLSEKEHRLLRLLPKTDGPFYVVGVTQPIDLSTVKHELVHGLYYTVSAYNQAVDSILEKKDHTIVLKALEKAGYHPSVGTDETNAYLMMGAEDLFDDGFRWSQKMLSLQKDLQKIFRNHFGFSLRGASWNKILSFFKHLYL